MRLRVAVTLLWTLTALTGALRAQVIDAVMRPGDLFLGELDTTDDVDLVRFDSVAGARLTVVVAAKKSSVRPSVTVRDTSDDSVVTTAEPANAKSRKVLIKNLELPSTGTYEIEVSGLDGTTGDYVLKFVEKVPKAVAVKLSIQDVPVGERLELGFEGTSGHEIIAIVAKAKKSSANPATPVLNGPEDAEVLGDELITKSSPKGDKHVLKRVQLTQTGAYVLSSANDADEDGELLAKLVLRRQKHAKRKLEELPSGEAEARSLSGTILASNDNLGLQGVIVSIADGPSTETDLNGHFLIQEPPAGLVDVTIDGTQPTNAPVGAEFGELHVQTQVAAEGASQLPQVIVLVDLAAEDTAEDVVEVDVETGITTEPIDAVTTDPDSLVDLSADAGVAIELGGVPASEPVTVSATPVLPENVPMPLEPEASDPLDASSYVTIQPANASFRANAADPGASEQGLDVVLENHRNLPVGTLVDIWSFDHDANDWVNRSLQTGNQGIVVDNGDGTTQIEASGVILKGGWHAPVVPVETNCATLVKGRVVSSGDAQPIPGATVATTLGQFATTDANGEFEIRAVPSYDPIALPGCLVLNDGTDRAFDLVVITPVDYGAQRVTRQVATVEVLPGDCTDVGDIQADVPTKGSAVLLLMDNGDPVAGASVELVGPSVTTQHSTGANGQFFVTCLEPGSYIASHTFDGDSEALSVTFTVSANHTTTVNLQRTGGAGKLDVTICVVKAADEVPGEGLPPVSGAKVRLVSKETPAGVVGTTNSKGKVTFEKVNPPYTVTAQVDRVVQGDDEPEVVRFATTVADIVPKTGVITVPMTLDVTPDFDQAPNRSLFGTVANLPGSQDPGFTSLQVFVYDSVTGESLTDFTGPGQVDPFSGSYQVGFFSSGNPVHVVLRESEFILLGDPEGDNTEAFVTTRAAFNQGVADPGPQGKSVLDFDYDTMIPFEEVPLTVVNEPSVIDRMRWGTELVTSGGPPLQLGSMDVEIAFSDDPILPETFWVPDLDHAALAGGTVLASGELIQTGDEAFVDPGLGLGPFVDRGSACQFDLDGLDDEAGVTFTFGDEFVRILQPAPNGEVDPEDAPEMLAVIDDRSTKFQRGFNSLVLEGEGLPEDFPVQVVVWELISRLGQDELDLPPTALPMFGAFGDFEVELETVIATGSSVLYDRLFDEQLPSRIQEFVVPDEPVCSHYLKQLFEVIED